MIMCLPLYSYQVDEIMTNMIRRFSKLFVTSIECNNIMKERNEFIYEKKAKKKTKKRR